MYIGTIASFDHVTGIRSYPVMIPRLLIKQVKGLSEFHKLKITQILNSA